VISGANPVAGTYTCTYTATDSGVSASKSLTIVIAASAPPSKTSNTITWAQLPNVSLTNGNLTLGATSNGTAGSPATTIYYTSNTPLVCNVMGNVVTILDTGYCELTADDDGNATFEAAAQATNSFYIFAICTPSINSGFQGQPYSQTFQTLGTVGSGSWSLVGGLPAGLSFNTTTGELSGNPSEPWNGNITITYTQGGRTHSRTYSLVINAPAGSGGGGGAPAPTPTPTPTPTQSPSATPTPTPSPSKSPQTQTLNATVNFGGDNTKFVGNSASTINKLANTIKAADPTSVTIVVTGWVNQTASSANDMKLALARAQATATALAAKGIDATVQVVAKGVHVTSGTSARRAEIKVVLSK
jgi:outer membrane protein OmpA-like peptidoglycan-associated protein